MKSFKRLSPLLQPNLPKIPTPIQSLTIPHIIKKKNTLTLAPTGTGKTLAYVIPILNDIIKHNSFYTSLIICSNRELATQIDSVIKEISKDLGIRTTLIIGGLDEKEQSRSLFASPHIIIGTPGRLRSIFNKTVLFNKVKYLILDECDKLFEKNFADDVSEIMNFYKKLDCRVHMFSATINERIEKMSKDFLRIEMNEELKIDEHYLLVPYKYKECYIKNLALLQESAIVFVNSCLTARTLSNFLRRMNIENLCLHGQMEQEDRNNVIKEFRVNNKLLIATDVASRGLDIINVKCVINYDVPKHLDYVHRIGRTGRNKSEGKAITFVTQYDVEILQKLENKIGKKLEKFEMEKEKAIFDCEKVKIVYNEAYEEIKERENYNIKKRRKN